MITAKPPRMTFSGASLELVRDAVEGALRDIQNHIGSSPNVIEYAGDIEDYENQAATLELLLVRINRKLEGRLT